MTKIELLSLWNSINPQRQNNVGRRIDPAHPLSFFVSYDEDENMQIMLISSYLPKMPLSSKQIKVRANERADHKYAICFSLTDSTLKEMFISLCWDLVDCSYNSSDETTGVKKVINRFQKWQRLFEKERSEGMSQNQVKGLIGELLVLKDICIPKYGISKSIEGWMGPLYSDRDFTFSDLWYEVKTISLSKSTINITSLDQLDTSDDGFIVICRVERASESEDSFTLNKLVEEIEQIIGSDQRTITIWENRLAFCGYKRDDEVSEEYYKFCKLDKYSVNDSFPRLRRSQLQNAIIQGSYELSIPAIYDWKAD